MQAGARGRVVRVEADEQVDAGAPDLSPFLSWSGWERGATSTLPVRLLNSARRMPMGSPVTPTFRHL
jgi:hypothetical protein